jgi:hypothetical protein
MLSQFSNSILTGLSDILIAVLEQFNDFRNSILDRVGEYGWKRTSVVSKSILRTTTHRAQPVFQWHLHQPIERPNRCPSVTDRLWEQRPGSRHGIRL